MYYLGINLSHDATIALIDNNNNLIYEIAEERLSIIKNHPGFPFKALNNLFEYIGIKPEKIAKIGISGTANKRMPYHLRKNLFTQTPRYDFSTPYPPELIIQLTIQGIYHKIIGNNAYQNHNIQKTLGLLGSLFGKYNLNQKITFHDHHLCHALPVLIYSPENPNKIIFTFDCAGDLLSGTVYVWQKDSLKIINNVSEEFSLGAIYSSTTEYLGFKRNRHEGKIAGLAAYGNTDKLTNKFSKIMPYDFSKSDFVARNLDQINIYNKVMAFLLGEYHAGMPNLQYQRFMLQAFKDCSPADVAAAVQQAIEKIVTDWVKKYVTTTGIKNVCLAGGLFSNVKLNQKISEIDSIDNVFIYPNMGDGGTAVGAALACNNSFSNQKLLDNAYKGPSYEGEIQEISKIARLKNIKMVGSKDYPQKIAMLISKGKIVGRFNGRLEFGPRALGNRSILADPRNPDINDILNKRLSRTEFMPFAPSVLAEYAPKIFKNTKKSEFAANFMTITYDVDKEWQSKVPGITHVDGTARPQLVRKGDNSSFYSIIQEFHKLTGIPMVINTSFNNHEEPIVCTPNNALKCLIEDQIDVLSIFDYLMFK